MAKVLRTHRVAERGDLMEKVYGEIILLTRGVACSECVEVLIEKTLYAKMETNGAVNSGTVLGFKFRVVHGPGVRPGSLAVITRTEILFK